MQYFINFKCIGKVKTIFALNTDNPARFVSEYYLGSYINNKNTVLIPIVFNYSLLSLTYKQRAKKIKFPPKCITQKDRHFELQSSFAFSMVILPWKCTLTLAVSLSSANPTKLLCLQGPERKFFIIRFLQSKYGLKGLQHIK